MRKRSQRLWLIGAAAILATGAVALAANGLQGAVNFYYVPSELVEKHVIADGRSARVGGLVEVNSVKHNSEGDTLFFTITDNKHTVPVVFDGIPPDLFREGQGVIADGKFNAEGTLIAKRVLAKHDENYMPKEARDKLCKVSPESCAGDGGAYAPKEPAT